ncbi:pentapeptide repeat-containing protein [Myxococcota bacterium]|nr:pentapeptide repeat-containing protein [Myxococcota bacterium]
MARLIFWGWVVGFVLSPPSAATLVYTKAGVLIGNFDIAAGATLNGADLEDAALGHVTLTAAELREANLSGADLGHATLTGADLTGADLSQADLEGASLLGADLTEANLLEADLSDAVLNGATLEHATMFEAEASPAFFFNATLNEANASYSNLSNSNLTGASLVYTNLYCANLAGAIFVEADLSHANLGCTDLSDTDFLGADLTGARFLGTTTGIANYDANTIFIDTWTGDDGSTLFNPVAAGWNLIPEPSTGLLLGMGVLAMAFRGRCSSGLHGRRSGAWRSFEAEASRASDELDDFLPHGSE